jgi:hypothetical protein
MKERVIYHNYQALTMQGEHLFYCSAKKASSYLRKGIAEVVSEDPFVFRLLFEPKGKGSPNQKPRENACVVCGTRENLTRHHVVPYAFRKLMSSRMKDHKSEDVVPMCDEDHRIYEIESSKPLLLKLLEGCSEEIEDRKRIIKGNKARATLKLHRAHLSLEKIAQYEEDALCTGKKYTDVELIMMKYGETKVYEAWKEDFVKWMKKKEKNFKFEE